MSAVWETPRANTAHLTRLRGPSGEGLTRVQQALSCLGIQTQNGFESLMAHQFHETGPTSQVEAGLLVLGDSRGRDRMNVALA